MANAFFSALGFNVVLTDPTSEETLRLSQLAAQGETCYPVKLIYGHMMQLIEKKVDYIFLPSIHTMRHEKSRVAHNYGCVYMQTAAKSVARALKLEEKGITLLNPEFDLDFGQEAMASAMVGLGKILGIPKLKCAAALLAGAMAVRRHTAAVEKQGKALLATLKPEDKVLVLITRNYGVSDPILNMGIPRLLLERGYKVITLSHLPGHSLDISGEYPNLYWPFGQHILSGAKLIAHHPNLYAVYLTNHGCGPGYDARPPVPAGDGRQAVSANRGGRAFFQGRRDYARRSLFEQPFPPTGAAASGQFPNRGCAHPQGEHACAGGDG